MQELIARECAPDKEVTLTIGQFSSGTVGNIIPETAVLQGTLRTFNSEIKQYLITRINEIVKNISSAFHAESKIDTLTDTPVLCCDEKRNQEIVKALESMNPEFNIVSGLHITCLLYTSQELIARECAPDKEVTLTIGQFSSGTVGNIIPETAVLQGTLRTFNSEIKQYLITRINEIVKNISSAFHAESKIDTLTDTPVLLSLIHI